MSNTDDIIEEINKTHLLMKRRWWWYVLGGAVAVLGGGVAGTLALAGNVAGDRIEDHLVIKGVKETKEELEELIDETRPLHEESVRAIKELSSAFEGLREQFTVTLTIPGEIAVLPHEFVEVSVPVKITNRCEHTIWVIPQSGKAIVISVAAGLSAPVDGAAAIMNPGTRYRVIPNVQEKGPTMSRACYLSIEPIGPKGTSGTVTLWRP